MELYHSCACEEINRDTGMPKDISDGIKEPAIFIKDLRHPYAEVVFSLNALPTKVIGSKNSTDRRPKVYVINALGYGGFIGYAASKVFAKERNQLMLPV